MSHVSQTSKSVSDDPVLGYSLSESGTCEVNNSTALKVVSVFYDWRQQTATVRFDSDIQLNGGVFHLNFTVMDVNTSREYTCEQLDCVKQVQSRGVSVNFEKVLSFTKAVVVLQNNPRLYISRANDSRVFTDYPVLIQAETPIASNSTRKSTEIPKVVYTSVKSIQLPATLFFAAVHPSFSVLFDETFARITTIALYASPPMTVLDEAILTFKDITLLPFQIPNMFGWLLSPSDCEPSFMLKRYAYECRFAENFGVDLTIFFFMITLTLLLKLLAKLAKRKGEEPQKLNKIFDSTSISASKLQGKRVEKITLEQILNWLDRNFGFMVLWAKVEGKQAEYLVFAFQDFWSNDGSKNRILSTVVAVVCLLHAIFSLWGTRKLISFITLWYNLSFSNRVTQKVDLPIDGLGESSLKTEQPKSSRDVGSSIMRISISKRHLKSRLRESSPSPLPSPSQQQTSMPLTVTVDRHRIIDLATNKQLETTWYFPLRFWYDQIKVPDSRIQLRVPVMSTLKNVASALFVIGLPSHPKLQCLGGITIEVMWFLFKYKNSLQTSTIDVLTELILSIAAVMFMMGKFFSYSVTGDFLQESLAIWMLTIILVMMLVTALVTILSVAVWAYDVYRKKKASKTARSSEKTCVSESALRIRPAN